jgi:hypothetical protein
MASESSLQRAAQAWCYPATSGKEMDATLAEVFADILDHELTTARADVERLTRELLMQKAESDTVIQTLYELREKVRGWLLRPQELSKEIQDEMRDASHD